MRSPSLVDGWPTEDEKRKWVRQHGLREAAQADVNMAKATEVSMGKQGATILNGTMRVVFSMGILHPVDEVDGSGNLTTTSYYALNDTRTGKTEAQILSTLSSKLSQELGYKQKVWVSQNGRQILIYETWCDGSAPHDVYALISLAPNASWNVKYLSLPEFKGYPGLEEHGPLPIGFLDDELLFDPLVSDKIYKMRLEELPEARRPTPFEIG